MKRANRSYSALAVPDGITGGMALYGADFGRYPLDPTLVFTKKTPLAAN